MHTGDTFGLLTAIRRLDSSHWEFRCRCGASKIILASSVARGLTRSCGCYRKVVAASKATTHGKSNTRTFHTWCGMRQRCTNHHSPAYKNYGGRGISVDPEWLVSFEAFLRDMGDCPKGMQLDRIDNSVGYCKQNCRWTTSRINNNNRRDNRIVIIGNEVRTVAEWARTACIRPQTLLKRLNKGMAGIALLAPSRFGARTQTTQPLRD